MSMRGSSSVVAWLVAAVMLHTHGTAHAANDFATCDPAGPLPVCDTRSGIGSCCRRQFSAGSVIIPMDRCHQLGSAPGNTVNNWCVNPSSGNGDHIYGLVYRLMQQGIPVYWVINPSKLPTDNVTANKTDIDFWAIGAGCTVDPRTLNAAMPAANGTTCKAPVLKLNTATSPSTLSTIAGSYTGAAIPFRSGAFVIDYNDRARFNQYWARQGPFAALTSPAHDFRGVNMYELQANAALAFQDYRTAAPYAYYVGGSTTAPVASTIDQAPPKLATVFSSQAKQWLAKANLDYPAGSCSSAAWNVNDVYCDISEAQIQRGLLISKSFTSLWADVSVSCATATKIGDWLQAVPNVRTAGTAAVIGASTVEAWEGCNLSWRSSQAGLTRANGPTTQYVIPNPQSLFVQFGDVQASFQPGQGAKWSINTGYKPAITSLNRVIVEDVASPVCDNPRYSTRKAGCFSGGDNVDNVSYYRRPNANGTQSTINGVVFYFGGQNPKTQPPHWRMLMNAFIGLPGSSVPQLAPPPVEVARAAPIALQLGNQLHQLQGSQMVYTTAVTPPTFTSGTAASFVFPHFWGHFRAIPITSRTGASAFTTATWDANAWLEAAQGADRVIFTNTTTGLAPTRLDFTAANASTLKASLGFAATADASGLISLVRAGSNGRPRLGAVDRSAAAVVGPSPTAGLATRPQVAFFGALDGMLHAVCVESANGCTAGRELWAFLPRTQLPTLSTNTSRIDGSPAVADVFDDIEGDGTKEWRTILVFQTGSGTAGSTTTPPAAYALDVTDPTVPPKLLWERVLPGVGLSVTMGSVRVGATRRHLTFLATNKGSTAGIQVIAVNTTTGNRSTGSDYHWMFDRTYTMNGMPATGSPGGVAGIDATGEGLLTDLLVPTLEGKLYRLDASSGQTPVGVVSPILAFEGVNHPIGSAPTVWKDPAGKLHTAVVSGGYIDNVAFTSAWVPLGQKAHYVVSVPIEGKTTLTIADDGTVSGGPADFVRSYGNSSRAVGQAVVSGEDLYFLTDSDAYPNARTYGLAGDTGAMFRVGLVNPPVSLTSTAVAGGGGLDVVNGQVLVGAGREGARSIDHTGDYTATEGTEPAAIENLRRIMWMTSNE